MEKISEERLKASFPGLRIHVYDEIDSTNTQAKRFCREGFYGPALLTAEYQSAGRGRQGKSFYSPAGTGIYMTLLYPVEEDLYSAVRMTAKASVAVYRGIRRCVDRELSIKWVNDIYIEDRKIAGILTEAVNDPETGRLRALVTGIGINVSTEDFPEDIHNKAGSLGLREFDRTAIAAAVTEELIREVSDLKDLSYLETYRKASCVLGREIIFTVNGLETPALAEAIDDDGALIVKTEQGETVRLDSGEISVRRKE